METRSRGATGSDIRPDGGIFVFIVGEFIFASSDRSISAIRSVLILRFATLHFKKSGCNGHRFGDATSSALIDPPQGPLFTRARECVWRALALSVCQWQ